MTKFQGSFSHSDPHFEQPRGNDGVIFAGSTSSESEDFIGMKISVVIGDYIPKYMPELRQAP